MAKVVDITEKLSFDENPIMQIGTLEVEVNADAETMLRLMGAFGNKGELQAVEEALNLIFKPEDVEKICNIKKGKKTFCKIPDGHCGGSNEPCHGRGRSGRVVTRTMIWRETLI